MKKIPVLATIQAAYQFVFVHLGTIIGLIWLPMVVITLAEFFVMQRYYAVAADAFASNAYGPMGPVMLSLLCYLVARLLFTAVMCVPLVQLAAGQRKDGVLVHFAFGPPEWRLFRALMGLAAFMMGVVLLAGTVLNMTRGASGLMEQLGAAALLALLCGAIVMGVRFTVLLPAVAVHEEGALLPRCWKLSAGNFWRLALIVLATLGPILILATVAEMLLTGNQGMASMDTSTARLAAQFHAMGVNMPISQGIGFVIAPLTLGLFCGASAFAYTAVKDSQNALIPPP